MSDAPTIPDTLTLDIWPDAAQALGVSRGLAYRMARAGELPTIRCGKRLKVPTAALRRMLTLEPVTPDEAEPADTAA